MYKKSLCFLLLTLAVLVAVVAQVVLTPPSSWHWYFARDWRFAIAAMADLLALVLAFAGERTSGSMGKNVFSAKEVLERYNPASNITLHVRSQRSRWAGQAGMEDRPALTVWRRVLLGLTALSLLVQYAVYLGGGETPALRWLWAATLLLAIVAVWQPGKPSWHRQNGLTMVVLLAVLLLALFLRAWHLPIMPLDFHGDMASIGLTAREMLQKGDWQLFRTRWANLPSFAFLPAAAGLHFVSDSIFGLRLPSVVEGLVSLLLLYLLARRLFDDWTALAAGLWLAGNVNNIHFSRIASYIDPLPWLLLGLLALWQGWKRRSPAGWLVAGMSMAAAAASYYSGRAGLLILVLFLLYLLLWQRSSLQGQWWGLLLALLGFLLVLGPMVIYFGQHWGDLMARTREVFLFHPAVMTHLQGKYGVHGVGPLLLEQSRRVFFAFQYFPDSSTQFGFRYPLLNALLAPWLFVGVGVLLARWRRPGPALLLIWFFTVLISGAFLTNNPPFWPRLVALLPAALLIAAEGVVTWGKSWWPEDKPGAFMKRVAVQAAFLLLLLLLSGSVLRSNWLRYQQYGEKFVQGRAWLGRYLAAQPVTSPVCLVDPPYHLSEREIAFLIAGHHDLEIGAETSPPDICSQPGQQSIFYPQQQALLRDWTVAVPGSGVAAVCDPAGRLTFWLWRPPGR